jgi:hypothetical protein
LYNVLADVSIENTACRLPFDPTEIIDNLRYERFANFNAGSKNISGGAPLTTAYYSMRPLLPVSMRRHLQRMRLKGWEKIPFPHWPVDRTVEYILKKLLALSLQAHNVAEIPFVWFWPRGVGSCAIVTHDVETAAGRDFCSELMDINDAAAIKSSFQIVPEKRYPVPESFLDDIRRRGFEINIHDLNHDGKLFSGREEFLRRAQRINRYAKEYGARGFRSGVLYRKADWYGAFELVYDMSIPNVAHLDPQRGGCCTVTPYFIGNILELPVTTTQDYSLFHILSDYSIGLWERQMNLIMEDHGLISFIIHPDYILQECARKTYEELLSYLAQLRAEGKLWIALPGEVADWWRQRSRMKLVSQGNRWQIAGAGREKARIAYARLENGQVRYHLEHEPESATHDPRFASDSR